MGKSEKSNSGPGKVRGKWKHDDQSGGPSTNHGKKTSPKALKKNSKQ